jgi:hypothetical protein
VPFKPVSTARAAPASPLQLFDELPRMTGAVPELWRQQGDVLREYAANFASKPDVAVELPTGTGKTIVGLLIADWRRRAHAKPVVYACPTHQLAHQVATVAKREGIPSVTLVGPNRDWPSADLSRYDGGDAIALTTYSAVFNARPKLGTPGTVLFDDAHAGEQFVADAWSVVVDRHEHPAAWAATLASVRGGLDGMFLQRLEKSDADVSVWHDVRLVVPQRRPGMIEQLDDALALLPERSPAWWRRSMIRAGLASCLVYVSLNQILIRPFIPPTSDNHPFTAADQRLYLSATLGHGGELERAFGRSSIARLPLPKDARNPRSGRRYFVFSDLTSGDTAAIERDITSRAGKALVLAPSTDKAVRTATELNSAGWPVMGKDAIERSLEPFAKADHALLALAGRYDGIDLPDKACRLVILDGLPDASHLQERYMATILRAQIALEERKRTRVAQGAGRATRNPSDHAIVVVRGQELTRYLTNPDTRAALDPDLQAEISFGLENSRDVNAADIASQVQTFLEQGDEWRTGAEPMLTEARRDAERRDPAGSALLAASASHEVDACLHAWRRDYVGAREAAVRAATALSGDEAVRSYRSFWLYLAAVWSFAAAGADPSAARTGAGLLGEAHRAARGSTWLREVDPGDVDVEALADDTPAVKEIAARLAAGIKRADIEAAIERMTAGLESVDHGNSEPALTELGQLLGAEAYKPPGQGRCDSAWCWAERIWIAVEAKTEHGPDGAIPMKDIRQANTQLESLAADRGVSTPTLSVDVIVSPRSRVHADAVAIARPFVYVAQPGTVRELAASVRGAWNDLLVRYRGHTGADLENLVRRVFAEYRTLPTQVRERLTADPVRP